jgi:hydrogenase expression/formation protein HypE
MEDTHIALAHGNGGRFMRELIEELFARHLSNPLLDTQTDAAALPVLPDGVPVMTTDGFTVQPLEFPGGDIGSLAAHGTINDLAVAGAEPRYLTLNCFVEEGIELALLDRVIGSLAAAAGRDGVVVVAGDTKVLRRGEGGGIYLATTGLGIRPAAVDIGLDRIQAGDRILVSGPVGDHGISVMLAREQFGLRGDLRSDAASVLPLTRAALSKPGLRFMRDPTRGGLATVGHELHRATGLSVVFDGPAVPVRDPVHSVCEMLGYDPLYLACEGRVVAVTAPGSATALLEAWRALPEGREAAIVGEMGPGRHAVTMRTEIGGERILEELEDDPLPRIC